MLDIESLKLPGIEPVSIRLVAGQCLGITGDSGCGKSRLLRAIADMDVVEGDVLLEKTSRKEFSGHAWRKIVCLLPAESQWWGDVVKMNFPENCLENALPYLNATGFDDTVFNWQVSRCSSGEKQRLAIARALANKPRILLLDEPTANLDEENAMKVETLISAYLDNNNAAAIWVSHNLSQLKRVSLSKWYTLSKSGLNVSGV